jgi:ubiquinone/menaquinone biosynthesis C-methylase UbiE
MNKESNTLKNPDFFWKILNKSSKIDNSVISDLRYMLKHNLSASKLSVLISYINGLSRRNKNIKILDYGAGGGQLVAYLYLLGYENITAVDVCDKKHLDRLNSLFKSLGMTGVVLHTYNTKTLPFNDGEFDLIVSQQVVEHVTNIEQYISECYRVLSKHGKALLDFPHRIVPFDTHTRMWFVHYFPVFVRRYFYNKYRDDGYDYYSEILHMKTPLFYNSLFKNIFDRVEDLTNDRIGCFKYKDYYEGNRKIRVIVDRVLHIPIIGFFFLKIVSFFANKTLVLYK